ncbi:MAG: MBOAT family O-acyltransferase [Acidimicrobiales bacterium]
MTFNSVEYFVFLFCVVLLHWAAHPRLRPGLLLAASYLFYATWNWRFVPLLAFATVVTYVAGRLLPTSTGTRRRALLWFAVLSSAAVVVGFKGLAVLTGGGGAAGGGVLGFGFGSVVENVVIPVGLSFYTFQVISYVVDVSRGTIEPERRFVTYALYVSFFPHLLAGPIVRAGRLIPQLHSRRRRPDPIAFSEGLQLLLTGLFKKVVVADLLAATVRTYLPALTSPDPNLGSVDAVLCLVVVLLSNYFDIWGYVDMARGSAKLLGVRMPSSFAQPYTRSRSWTEFWRRWQVTIMGWFRDYVYRPVRGSTRTRGREALALLATFVAAGLWHGLTPGWLVWGLLTAGLLIAEQWWKVDRVIAGNGKPTPATRTGRVLRQVRRSLYVFVCLLIVTPWAGTGSLSGALTVYGYVFSAPGAIDANLVLFTVLAVAVMILLDGFERREMDREGFPNPVTTRRWVVYGCMVLGIVVASGATTQEFVYFRF